MRKRYLKNSDEPEERDQSSVSICFFQYMESQVTSKIKLEVLKLDHRRTMVRLGNPSWKPNCWQYLRIIVSCNLVVVDVCQFVGRSTLRDMGRPGALLWYRAQSTNMCHFFGLQHLLFCHTFVCINQLASTSIVISDGCMIALMRGRKAILYLPFQRSKSCF
jgi:hypothetical protein